MMVAMKTKTKTKDLRATPRFELQKPVRLNGSTLPILVKPTGASRHVEGRIRNISSGGLCLLVENELKVSETLVAEIALPGTRASIPTLLQVRWLRKSPSGGRYRAGLHFVIQAGIAQLGKAPKKGGKAAKVGVGAKRKSKKKRA